MGIDQGRRRNWELVIEKSREIIWATGLSWCQINRRQSRRGHFPVGARLCWEAKYLAETSRWDVLAGGWLEGGRGCRDICYIGIQASRSDWWHHREIEPINLIRGAANSSPVLLADSLQIKQSCRSHHEGRRWHHPEGNDQVKSQTAQGDHLADRNGKTSIFGMRWRKWRRWLSRKRWGSTRPQVWLFIACRVSTNQNYCFALIAYKLSCLICVKGGLTTWKWSSLATH